MSGCAREPAKSISRAITTGCAFQKEKRAQPPSANSTGRTKSGVVWELSVKRLDAERCELTNHVIGKTTLQYWESLGKEGIPFEVAKKA